MHLKNVPNEQSIYARKLIYEVVIQAELGNLSEASRLDVSPLLTGARRDAYYSSY